MEAVSPANSSWQSQKLRLFIKSSGAKYASMGPKKEKNGPVYVLRKETKEKQSCHRMLASLYFLLMFRGLRYILSKICEHNIFLNNSLY